MKPNGNETMKVAVAHVEQKHAAGVASKSQTGTLTTNVPRLTALFIEMYSISLSPTLHMSGGWRHAKHAGRRPRDGRAGFVTAL